MREKRRGIGFETVAGVGGGAIVETLEAGGGAQGTQGLGKDCTRREYVPFVASDQRFSQ